MRGGRRVPVGQLLFASLPIWYYLAWYGDLPQEVPIHFTSDGVADRLVSKSSPEVLALCCLGYCGFLLGLGLRKGIACLTKSQEEDNQRVTDGILRWNQVILTVFFTGLSVYCLGVTGGGLRPDNFVILRWAAVTVALVCMIAGNALPKLRRNFVSGVCTAYALSGDDPWMASQRWGGRVLMLGGAAALVCALLPGVSHKTAAAVCGAIFASQLLAVAVFSLGRGGKK